MAETFGYCFDIFFVLLVASAQQGYSRYVAESNLAKNFKYGNGTTRVYRERKDYTELGQFPTETAGSCYDPICCWYDACFMSAAKGCYHTSYGNYGCWSEDCYPACGGTRNRNAYKCNCYCCEQSDGWLGRECEDCELGDMVYKYDPCPAICYNGGHEEGGVCQCPDVYYGDCCSLDCPVPNARCEKYFCDPQPPSECTWCWNNTGTYKAYHLDSPQCYPRCNWLGHWCWPGVCDQSEDYLASTCNCIEGFELYTPNSETTKCKLSHTSDIQTCRLGAESPHGEAANSTFSTNSTSCDSTEDAYVNFSPRFLFFQLDMAFELPMDPPDVIPDYSGYVSGSSFGVINAEATVNVYTALGDVHQLDHHILPNNGLVSCSVEVSREKPANGNTVTCKMNFEYPEQNLEDGEKICHLFKVTSSGYLLITDVIKATAPQRFDEYGDTYSYEERCFRTDYTKPDHCANSDTPCQEDILQFGQRIVRHKLLNVTFDGWFDPEPDSAVSGASGMKEYEIELREVQYTPTELFADFKSIATYISQGGEPVPIPLPERENPSMYALYLWALDSTQESPNYKTARRFVLTDNSSTVVINDENPIIPITASPVTDYEWQIELVTIELHWQNHFHNSWHVHTNLLLPIRSDGNDTDLAGVFEQLTGELPVSGTENVDGIVNFEYGYFKLSPTLNNTGQYKPVPNPLEQKLSLREVSVNDGDVMFISLRAIDIMNNTEEDQIRLNIDSSPPRIEDMYLVKDGYRYLYVHNSTDLSKMNMTFVAYDPHSGNKQVKWQLGHQSKSHDVGQGTLPVVRLNKTERCEFQGHCYCPDIGECQYYNYFIPLEGLIANDTHEGDHHREYFFTFEIMNEAHLYTVGEVKILVDDSPPEIGHVFDGPTGSKDRDYQSDFLLHAHWQGFIDHESGITKYHYAIGEKCYSKIDMQFIISSNDTNSTSFDGVHLGETTNTFVNFDVDTVGFYQFSVIAFNGAMEPSVAVCSSGVIIDDTPPVVTGIHWEGSRHQKSVLCDVELADWFLNEAGELRELSPSDACIILCSDNETETRNQELTFKRFPTQTMRNGTITTAIDYEESEEICSLFPANHEDFPMYLPMDNIHLMWNFEEPESQMLDYFIGMSSNGEDITTPDIKGFSSTHNRTQTKCVHCGIGEGEIFYLVMKAKNKAGLADLFPIGPVIVDMTPAEYQGGISVEVEEEFLVMSWPLEAFVDDQDGNILLEYEWAIGTLENPIEVYPFTSKIFPYTEVSEIVNFNIEFEKALLQLHNQDRDTTYYFSLKCINRAGLHTTVRSDGFIIHSKVLPSSGMVYHVSVNGPESKEPIGFQEDQTELCARWYGFEHYQGEIIFNLGIGSLPGVDDIHPLSLILDAATNHFCLDSLTLQPLQKYYFVLDVSNKQGSTNASSEGVFVAPITQVLDEGLVINGNTCPKQFNQLLDTNITIQNSVHYNISKPFTSIPGLTLKLVFPVEDIPSFSLVQVIVDTEIVPLIAWEYSKTKVSMLHHFIHKTSNISMTIAYSGSSTVMEEVSLHHCKPIPEAQSSTETLHSEWTFPYDVDKYISHFELAVREDISENSSLTYDFLTDYRSVGYHKEFNMQLPLQQGTSYKTLISPCFSYTCVPALESYVTTVDAMKPYPGWVHASLNIDPDKSLVDSHNYLLMAEWEGFVVNGAAGHEPVKVYDWTIALDRTGTSSLLEWRRVIGSSSLEEIVHLPVYKHRELFFILRCTSKANIPILHPTLIQLLDLYPPAGVEVFDLSADYNLDPLKDLLHSGNLGAVSRELHTADVDFTKDTERISGALLGVQCQQYTWNLQEGEEVNCYLKPDHKDCIDQKLTTENIVSFNRQSLQHGKQYFLCVHSMGEQCTGISGCSNGFYVDTEYPLPGKVHPGSSAQSDTSTLLVSWEGFSDLEEETVIPYAHGIKRYLVGVGAAPFEQDIRGFEDVGITDHDILTGLKMTSGHQYFITVIGCDHVDLCSNATSQPVLIDSSPPVVGEVLVSIANLQLNKENEQELVVRWAGFEDPESGITESYLAIGSTAHSQNIQGYTLVEGNHYTHTDQNAQLKDGAVYFVQIKVVNGAGLWSLSASQALLYDTSPPQLGYVRHGTVKQPRERYTRDTDSIQIHWGGFLDPHTGVAFYRVAAGTEPRLTNLLHWRDVALRDEFESSVDLRPGQPYFITVEVCNSVLLCSQVTASPLVADNSPPVPGVIHVGFSEEHENYQADSKSLSVHWVGFHDSQSGIHHYDWCVVQASDEECTQVHNAHSSTSVVKSGLQLPQHTRLHVILYAHNNVNLTTKATSRAFIIDDTPPVVLSDVMIVTYGSLKGNRQFDRSYISLEWDIQDDKIPMGGHVIALTSHDDGAVPIENLVIGDVKNITIPLASDQHFKDGNVYNVKVSGCNAAKLCTTSESEDFLVDSSPPLLGGFFEPMYWASDPTGSTINLTWAGFVDPHSEVSHYYLMISSQYNGFDLSGGILQVQHDMKSEQQRQTFFLPDVELPVDSSIYLSIWAENGAGITSDAAKVSVFVLPHSSVQQRYGKTQYGELDIEKHSCDVQYCSNDCTCAVVNQQCLPDVKYKCASTNTTDGHVLVYNGLMNTSEQYFTPSAVCLPGHWISNLTIPKVTRYEWSVSMLGHEPGFGIFDIAEDKIWFDVELYDRAVYCLPDGILTQGEQYMFHVRAWHDFYSYSHYRSQGVLIDGTPPRQGLGRHVLDLNSQLKEEVDFTTDTAGVYAGWEGVFTDAETGIQHYEIAIGTSQGGNELLGPLNVQLHTNVSFTSVSLVPGYKYFTTVYAYNPLGMVEMAYSDGFIVDLEPPTSGVVFTSLSHSDARHQAATLRASWHGFSDGQSFIKDYLYSIVEDNTTEAIQFESSILETSLEIPLSGKHHGKVYRVHVIAVDAAGHESEMASSNSVLIDHTPPVTVTCDEYVEEYSAVLNCSCSSITIGHPYSSCKCAATESYPYTRHSLALVEITTSKQITSAIRLEFGDDTHWVKFQRINHASYKYQVFYMHHYEQDIIPLIYVDSTLPTGTLIKISSCEYPTRDNSNSPINIKQIGHLGLLVNFVIYDPESTVSNLKVAVGTNTGGFQLLPFTDVGKGQSLFTSRNLQHMMQVSATVIAENGAGLKSVFTTETLLIDWTPPAVSDIEVSIENDLENLYFVTATWVVIDEESEVTDCLWQIGHIPDASDILPVQPTTSLSSAHISNISLSNADNVHVTIICSNSLDLTGKSHGAPVTVWQSPPGTIGAFVKIHPKTVSYFEPQGEVQGSKTGMEFSHGAFEDDVGIDHYQYRVTENQGDVVTDWTPVNKQDHVIVEDMMLADKHHYTVSVRATNKGDIDSEDVQAGVYVSVDGPQLTGDGATWSLTENSLSIDFGQVFTWDNNEQSYFEVFAGSSEGASDFIHALVTKDTSLSITSNKLLPPSSCYFVLTCVSSSGLSVTYTQTIHV